MQEFREDVRHWLEANCPQSMRTPMRTADDVFWGGKNATFISDDQKSWFEAMRDKHWIVPNWPKEYGGGGLSKDEQKILKEEIARLGCRPALYSFGIWMLGPALLKYGSEEQKLEYLPKIASGEIRWCQGYSEPGAGSDLANLQTKAEDNGDHYLVSGQKVWTSYADKADWIFCLVRTDMDAPKRRGISFLLIDMTTEGINTQPIKLISGKSPFCETFLDNVKVPKANLVGIENQGWTIAKYLLAHERESIGALGDGEGNKPLYNDAIELIGLNHGILRDTTLRTDITRYEIDNAAFEFTLERIFDEAKAGTSIGALSSFMKFYGTELNKSRYELKMEIGGYNGLGWEGEKFENGKLARDFCRTKGNSIEGGTSEIQLNIIAKRILGLK